MRATSTQHQAYLSQVSFTLIPKEVVFIAGSTGSTKVRALMNGCFAATCLQWHNRLSYVSQTPYLLDGKIEVNVEPCSYKVEQALEKV